MVNCYLCGKGSEESEVAEGIYDGKIVNICSICSIEENIPLIKHPPDERFDHVEKKESVRERLERMSSLKRTVAVDQEVATKNLAKIKFPPKKQTDESLAPNYDWRISSARRRMKISIRQLSEMSGISEEDIDSLEHGQLVENFKEKISKLELYLDAKLLAGDEHHEKFVYPEKTEQQKEEEILEGVRAKMGSEKKGKEIGEEERTTDEEEEILLQAKRSYEEIQKRKIKEKEKRKGEVEKEKDEIVTNIASGKFDFSKRKDLKNITLKDLQELKRKKEKNELFGEDVELEDLIDDREGSWG